MKNFFRPHRLSFYTLSLCLFFLLGLAYAKVSGAGKNQGLAGGAIVLSHGVMFGGIALIASMFVGHYLSKKHIVILNIIFLAFTLSLFVYFRIMYKAKHKEDNDGLVPTYSSALSAVVSGIW